MPVKMGEIRFGSDAEFTLTGQTTETDRTGTVRVSLFFTDNAGQRLGISINRVGDSDYTQEELVAGNFDVPEISEGLVLDILALPTDRLREIAAPVDDESER